MSSDIDPVAPASAPSTAASTQPARAELPRTGAGGYRGVVLDLLRGLQDYRRLRFLELGCGDGDILQALRTDGADVRGTTFHGFGEDYTRQRPYPPGLPIDQGVDLNKPLAYPSGSFDVVFSTEVIEHIELHRQMIGEAARVLRPGGWFVLTTPNLHRLLSRLMFFASGVHHAKRELLPWGEPLAHMEEYHHHCVEFPTFHWLLWKNGLRIRSVHNGEVNPLSYPLLALWPLNWLASRVIVKKRTRSNEEDVRGRHDLLRWMNSVPMLISEQICVVARKDGA